jgi:hypothetical protein
MTDNQIHAELRDILSRLKWLAARDGSVCHETCNIALRKALGLLNQVSVPANFTRSRSALFAVMNLNRAVAQRS